MRIPGFFRFLIRLFPRRFRDRYGAEMEAALEAELRRGRARGRMALGLVWASTGLDLLVGVGREWRRERGRAGLGSWGMDMAYAVRSLLRRPALTGAAVVTLALGIGITTAVFTLVNGLMFKPLPYHEPDRLVQIWSQHRERGWTNMDVTLPDAWAWREAKEAFQDLAAFTYIGLTDQGDDLPRRIDGVWSTANLMSVLGVAPILGRDFRPEDAREDAPAVALLSHGYWVDRMGADPGAVGDQIRVNGGPVTVIGVMPPDFEFMAVPAQVFIPFRGDPAQASRDEHGWQTLARLAPGVSVSRADEAANRASLRMAREYPETHRGWSASVLDLRAELLGDVAPRAASLLLGAVTFVLLMACVNVATLLLARGADRSGEMAIRGALGAGRSRLIRQLLVESLVLGLVGGSAGLAVAALGSRVLIRGLPDNLPPVFEFGLDPSVLAFSSAVVLGSVLVFGVFPAIRTVPPSGALRSHGRTGAPMVGGGLVVVQTALAVSLLVGGSVMALSVAGMAEQDMGWDAEGVLTARLSPRGDAYPTDEEVESFHGAVLDEVRALPGVTAAGAIQAVPLQGQNQMGTVRLQGGGGAGQAWPTRVSLISPGYLEAMGIRVRQGRGVSGNDRLPGERVALVNRTFVERYLDGEEAVGAFLEYESGSGAPIRVIGVVEDHVERGVEWPVEPSLFLPLAQGPLWTRTLVVRSAGGSPADLAGPLRQAVARVDPGVALFDVRTMAERVALRLGGFTFIAGLMGAFALLSLTLGAVGIYGVSAHTVSRRTREMGVRLVLGADPAGLRRSVLLQGMRRVGLGVAVGLAVAVPLTGALRGVVVGVNPRSPWTFLAAALVLLSLGALGSWLPALRASRVDPVTALAAD